jgi:hypothetical protein
MHAGSEDKFVATAYLCFKSPSLIHQNYESAMNYEQWEWGEGRRFQILQIVVVIPDTSLHNTT